MKVYVEDYGPLDPQPESARRGNRTEYGVRYSSEPSWTIEHRPEAEGHSARLRTYGVHVGEHHCEFEVEETETGYAIVCPVHPVLSKG